MKSTVEHLEKTDSSATNPPYRLNFSLNTEAKAELEQMRKECNKSSLVDVLRSALALYKVVIDHQKSGGRVIFRHADNSEETLRFL